MVDYLNHWGTMWHLCKRLPFSPCPLHSFVQEENLFGSFLYEECKGKECAPQPCRPTTIKFVREVGDDALRKHNGVQVDDPEVGGDLQKDE